MSQSLSLLLASAALLLCLSPHLTHSLPVLGDYDQIVDKPEEKSFSWNTPFRFQYEAPTTLDLDARFPPLRERDVTVGGGEAPRFARLSRSQASERALLSMLLWPHLSSSLGLENVGQVQPSAYRRDSRGIKRKMFWSPLGYVPHRDIKVTDKEKSAGTSEGQGSLFRYG